MSLLRRREAPQAEERGLRISIANGGGAFYAPDGVSSNPMRAVAHSAARRVLCTAVASLPVQTVNESGGVRRRVADPLIVRSPSAEIDQQAWVYQVVDSWLDAGNAYLDVVQMDSLGRPTQVEVVAPSSVSWLPVNGRLVPHVDGKPRDRWPRGDLFHVAYYPQAGSPVGLSPSDIAAGSVRATLAAEKFGTDFLLGVNPTHILKANAAITQEQAQAAKASLMRMRGTREPAVFGGDWSLEKMSVDPKDSQFIDVLRWECEQAARIYLVPPQMIYAATSGQSVTYANASQTDLAFLKWSLRWPLRRLQWAWSAMLPQPWVVRFNVDALLEVTAMERAQVHEIRLRTKTRTVNEVRRIEDEPPFDDAAFDEPGVPADNYEPPSSVGDDGLPTDGGAADV